MADDELDDLYWVQPGEFTAQRTKLAAAAKRRCDAAAAKRISAARKPTMAAWIVNRLALRHKDATQRLGDLGDRLRAAHEAMDGEQIRGLSAEQHKLIGELARAAFEEAEVKEPSSTVRDDVTGTLQAAVADPDVRSRLGRLDRPEQWSGFGGFGAAAPVVTSARGAKATAAKAKATSTPAPARPAKRPADDKAARQLEKLKAAVAAAERAQAQADDTLSQRQAARDAARLRRDEALAGLRAAEREVSRAEEHYDIAKRASRDAAEVVKEAKAQLKRA